MPQTNLSKYNNNTAIFIHKLLFSHIGAYFESWAKFVIPPLSNFKTFKEVWDLNIEFGHMTHSIESRIGLCKASLTHPSQQEKLESRMLIA